MKTYYTAVLLCLLGGASGCSYLQSSSLPASMPSYSAEDIAAMPLNQKTLLIKDFDPVSRVLAILGEPDDKRVEKHISEYYRDRNGPIEYDVAIYTYNISDNQKYVVELWDADVLQRQYDNIFVEIAEKDRNAEERNATMRAKASKASKIQAGKFAAVVAGYPPLVVQETNYAH